MNVVTVYDVRVENDLPYLAMKLADEERSGTVTVAGGAAMRREGSGPAGIVVLAGDYNRVPSAQDICLHLSTFIQRDL